jgi:hypothetical protein
MPSENVANLCLRTKEAFEELYETKDSDPTLENNTQG